jgi:hypothetical protein
VTKHFLDPGGLGVRELYVDGNDLLVLAGPTMVLDGPVRLLRWPGGATTDAGTLIHADELEIVHQLPHGDREDHAEGFTKLEAAGTTKLVIAYDSPAENRKTAGKTGVLVDLFPWR